MSSSSISTGLADVRPARRPYPAPRGLGQRTDGGDARGDLRVGRRHDLAAVAEVDLVAVVLRRVVTGGHHHPGHAAELADREGQQRCRQRPRHDESAQSCAGHHLGGVAGEHVGVVAGVVPDHHGCSRGAPASLRYAARPAAVRVTTTRFIRFGPAPSAPRRPCGAELECAVEAVGQLRTLAWRSAPRARPWCTGRGPRPPRPGRASTKEVTHGRRLVAPPARKVRLRRALVSVVTDGCTGKPGAGSGGAASSAVQPPVAH